MLQYIYFDQKKEKKKKKKQKEEKHYDYDVIKHDIDFVFHL